jgi:hypothetical protein
MTRNHNSEKYKSALESLPSGIRQTEQAFTDKSGENNLVAIRQGGKTFLFIDHYAPGQTFTDIVKTALRREFESG